MRVRDAMSVVLGDILAAEESDSLADAATVLSRADMGAVIVVGSRGPSGILTERDLVRAIADRADLQRTQVAEYMTECPVSIEQTAGLEDAAGVMSENRVRHLLVTFDGEVAGVVSARDLVDALAAGRATVEQPGGPG